MSDDPLHIALVSPYDYAYPGGVNEHIRYLARHLRSRGHHVEVIAPDSSGKVAEEEGMIRLDAAVLPVPFGGAIARVTLAPTIWNDIKLFLAGRRYDLIHVHEPMAPAISPAFLYHSRSINIGTFHTYRESHRGYELGLPLFRYFVAMLHGRIAVSAAARDAVKDYFPGDYQIIPNGIEVAEFQRQEDRPFEAFRKDGKLNILFLGRLDKRKGFRYLLRAFRKVKAVVPSARLIVAGAYEREDRLPYVRYVRHFRIRDVKFVGRVSGRDKARWYKTADLFCAPSTGFESFGIVLTEAMAAGTPVVASNIAGYRDVVENGVTGELVPPRDADALADTLIRLLRDAAHRQRLREAGLKTVQRYNWSRVSAEVETFYRDRLIRAGRKPLSNGEDLS